MRNTKHAIGAERRGGVFEPAVDRLKRKPDRAHHQRKTHDAAGQRRAGPAERKDDAEIVGEERANRASAPERYEQQIAGDDRRQHQRQVDDPVEQRLAPELLPRQQPADGNAERQRASGGDNGDTQRQLDRSPFGGGEAKHGRLSGSDVRVFNHDAGFTKKVKP